MVLVETIRIKGPFSLKIRRIRKVRNREKRINLNIMIPLHVIDTIRSTPTSV